jgi:hypothetical protein
MPRLEGWEFQPYPMGVPNNLPFSAGAGKLAEKVMPFTERLDPPRFLSSIMVQALTIHHSSFQVRHTPADKHLSWVIGRVPRRMRGCSENSSCPTGDLPDGFVEPSLQEIWWGNLRSICLRSSIEEWL